MMSDAGGHGGGGGGGGSGAGGVGAAGESTLPGAIVETEVVELQQGETDAENGLANVPKHPIDEFDFDLSSMKKHKDQVPFVKQRDKVFFTLGVVNVLVIAYAAGGHPGFLTYYYTIKFPLLLGIRWWYYTKKHWQYFLLDFCYFANLGVLFHLWFGHNSPELFMVVFGVCNGPLAVAVVVFQNKLVFHSLDKVTSAFIHLTPVTLTFVVRWLTADMWWPGYSVCELESCPSPLLYLVVYPLAYFAGHQVLYWILIKFVCCLPKDPAYLTSFRYLTRRGFFKKVTHIAGPKWAELFFAIYYVLFAFVSLLPVYLWYSYMWVHFAFICIIIVCLTWNGAGFYVEVFSKGYGKLRNKRGSTNVSFIAR